MERVLARIRSDGPVAFFDVLVVVVSFMTLLFIRFNGSIPDTYTERLYSFLPVIVAAHMVANWMWGNYGQIWRHASIAEARRIFLAGATAGAFIFLVNPMNDLSIPRSVAVIGSLGSAVLMGVVRFQVRLMGSRKQVDRSATRVVVVGAGEAGAAILREMQRRPDNGRTPVVVVDDDPRKQGRNLLGTPVVGSLATLDAVVHEYRAEEVLVAIPSADQELIRFVIQGAEMASVPVTPATSRSRTSWAVPRWPPTSTASGPPCTARSCSSPVPAGRSAPRSRGRCRSASPAGCCCSTTTRPTCTTPGSSSRAPTSWSWPTSAIASG